MDFTYQCSNTYWCHSVLKKSKAVSQAKSTINHFFIGPDFSMRLAQCSRVPYYMKLHKFL